MAANYAKPDTTDTDVAVLGYIVDNFVDVVTGAVAGSNPPTGAIRWSTNKWEKWSGAAWGDLVATYSINVATVAGYTPGNGSGAIPISNGTVNTNLNADKVDGFHASASAGANEIPVLDGGGKLVGSWLPNTSVTPGSYSGITIGADGRVTAASALTTLAGYGITDAAAIAGSASQVFSIGAASSANHAARATQVQNSAFINLGTVAGTDTYTATLTPTLAAYAAGQFFQGKVTNANTSTTPTLNVDSRGALTIKKWGGAALRAGDIQAGAVCQFYTDGTDFFLLNPFARVSYGKMALPIAAAAMAPSSSGGCAAIATVVIASGPDISYLAFDASSEESCQFAYRMPESWNESSVTFRPIWSHAATTTNFGVVWQLEAVAVGDNEALGIAFGTGQTSTDTGGTTDRQYLGPESAAITVGGSPTAGDVVYFKLSRKTGNANDTMAIDARLHGITLYITTDTELDG